MPSTIEYPQPHISEKDYLASIKIIVNFGDFTVSTFFHPALTIWTINFNNFHLHKSATNISQQYQLVVASLAPPFPPHPIRQIQGYVI